MTPGRGRFALRGREYRSRGFGECSSAFAPGGLCPLPWNARPPAARHMQFMRCHSSPLRRDLTSLVSGAANASFSSASVRRMDLPASRTWACKSFSICLRAASVAIFARGGLLKSASGRVGVVARGPACRRSLGSGDTHITRGQDNARFGQTGSGAEPGGWARRRARPAAGACQNLILPPQSLQWTNTVMGSSPPRVWYSVCVVFLLLHLPQRN